MEAWVITWEGTSTTNELAFILHHNFKIDTVSERMKFFYISSLKNDVDKFNFMSIHKNFPFYYKINPKKQTITCGDNPHLFARRANVTLDSENEIIKWDDL